MISAFGVDHGEISKGRTPPKSFWGRTARLTRAQKRTKGVGKPTGPEKIKGALNRIGEADVSLKNIGEGAGRTATGIGGVIERHPGLTGTALVGGGAAGGAYALNQRLPKKKRS